MRLEQTVTVSASPGRVYETVADVPRRPQWLHELRRVSGAARPVEVGDRFTGESSLLFHDFVGTAEVVRAEPGRALGEVVYLGARFTSEWEFTPSADGQGTVVRHCISIDFPDGPLGRLERWVLRRRLRTLQRTSLATLSHLLH